MRRRGLDGPSDGARVADGGGAGGRLARPSAPAPTAATCEDAGRASGAASLRSVAEVMRLEPPVGSGGWRRGLPALLPVRCFAVRCAFSQRGDNHGRGRGAAARCWRRCAAVIPPPGAPPVAGARRREPRSRPRQPAMRCGTTPTRGLAADARVRHPDVWDVWDVWANHHASRLDEALPRPRPLSGAAPPDLRRSLL